MSYGMCACAIRVTCNDVSAGGVVSTPRLFLPLPSFCSLVRRCGTSPIKSPPSGFRRALGEFDPLMFFVPLEFCHGVVVSTFGVFSICGASPS
jgi:hypothetical protein